MPLKLAGILMKYMQLQGAQCPPASGVLIKPPAISAAGALLRETYLFPSSRRSSVTQPRDCFWDVLKGGEHPAERLGRTAGFSLLCEKTCWSGACTCMFGAGTDLPTRGARRLFIRQAVVQDFDNVTCFSDRRRCAVCSEDLKASRNPAKPPRA